MLLKGIDVSLHQGTINWDQVARSGIKFAVVKATQELFTDPQFQRNQREARRTMARVGYYHFFKLGPSPEAQADYFVSRLGPLRLGEFLVLDWEQRGLTPATYRDQAERFLRRVHAHTGKKPFIYGSPSLLEAGQFASWAKDYQLWIAHWGTPKPRSPWPWSIWQHSATGTVPGISGAVDLNFAPLTFVYQNYLIAGGLAAMGLGVMVSRR